MHQSFVDTTSRLGKTLVMNPGAGLVPARYLRALLRHLEQCGLDTSLSLAAARLSPSTLAHPQACIERDQLTIVLQHLVKASGRSDLGFELGMLTNIGTADVVGQLLLNEATLARGLRRAIVYFPLLTPSFRLKYREERGAVSVICSISRPLPYDMAIMGLEGLAVSMHRLMLFLTQEKSVPCTLDLSWAAPPHSARYRSLKGAKVHFDQGREPGFILHIPTSLADVPLPMANPLALQAAEESCRRLLASLTLNRSWLQWVGYMLRSVDGHFPSQSELAAMVGISSRTLARHLEEEGVSYRALAGQVRHARAVDMLSSSSLSISAIAQVLGYSDAANFSRAFREVTGIAPGLYRSKGV